MPRTSPCVALLYWSLTSAIFFGILFILHAIVEDEIAVGSILQDSAGNVPEATRRQFGGGVEVTDGIVTHGRCALQMVGHVGTGIVVHHRDQIFDILLFAEHGSHSGWQKCL